MANAFAQRYVCSWLAFCALAAILIVVHRKKLAPEAKLYLGLLLIRWKVAVFVPAFIFVTFAGPYTDDETWDVVSGGGMSILTFLTAAWSIGTVYKVLQRKRPLSYVVIAVALWLFSSSWFYDGYLLLRDGSYTPRWAGNLILSPIIYLCAGLLWNLEARSRWWGTVSFLREDWPGPPSNRRFIPIMIMALPLVALALFVLVGFVRWHVDG